MEVFQYDFMQRAFLAATAIAIFAPILGLFLILRRQSLMSDTLSHISLAGVALGYLLGFNPTITTAILVSLAALLLEYLRQVYADYSDISVAMMMSGGMALGLLLMAQVDSVANINSYLFGSIVTITDSQIYLLSALAVGIVLAYFIFRKPLYVLTFDEDTAFTAGLPTKAISVIFSVVTGLAISVMMPIAGALLVSAIMIMPAALAMRVMKSFNSVIVTATVIALVGMYSGLIISYYVDTPPGATIAAIFIIIFVLESLLLAIFKRTA